MRVEVDIDGSMRVQDFLAMLDRNNAVLGNYVVVGPAGGNPCVQVYFGRYQDAQAFMVEYEPGITEERINQRIHLDSQVKT